MCTSMHIGLPRFCSLRVLSSEWKGRKQSGFPMISVDCRKTAAEDFCIMIGQLAKPSFLRYNKANNDCVFAVDEGTGTLEDLAEKDLGLHKGSITA